MIEYAIRDWAAGVGPLVRTHAHAEQRVLLPPRDVSR
jgi:hypothetical protein